MMKTKKIIISGPPGSGKTTIINALNQKGYLIHPEINPKEINKEVSRIELSTYIFTKRIQQYKNLITNNIEHNTKTYKNNNFFFFDRSLIDVVAYMNFWKEKYPSRWNDLIMKNRYEKIIFYTPNWEEIYQTTEQRPENYMEAKKIDLFLREAFAQFNYKIIEIPKFNTSKRVNFILNKI